MNLRGLFFLFLPCFLMVSCWNEPNDKTTNTIKIEHDYPDSEGEPQKPLPVAPIPPSGEGEEEKSLENIYRDLWQNPIKVIQKMGDLEGKTVADIGAGPVGYFTINLAARSNAAKILALDINPKALKKIENAKKLLPKEIGTKIETREVEPEDPKLENNEADIILIVNTAPYFKDRVVYFKNMMDGLAPDGKVVLIDFKKKYTRGAGPPIDSRIPLGEMERDLAAAGYSKIKSDDRTLEYQYIIIAGK